MAFLPSMLLESLSSAERLPGFVCPCPRMEFYFELPKLRQRSFTAIGKVLEKNGFHQVKPIGPVERITLFGCLAGAFRSPSSGPQFYLSRKSTAQWQTQGVSLEITRCPRAALTRSLALAMSTKGCSSRTQAVSWVRNSRIRSRRRAHSLTSHSQSTKTFQPNSSRLAACSTSRAALRSSFGNQ